MDNMHVQDHVHAHLNTNRIYFLKELVGNQMLNVACHHTIFRTKDDATPKLSIWFLDHSSISLEFVESIHTFYYLHSYTRYLVRMYYLSNFWSPNHATEMAVFQCFHSFSPSFHSCNCYKAANKSRSLKKQLSHHFDRFQILLYNNNTAYSTMSLYYWDWSIDLIGMRSHGFL
jgi:hypothetical protein